MIKRKVPNTNINININKQNSFFVLKIIDGLFLVNAFAARDIQFLKNNKIRLIINCAPNQLKFISNQEFLIQQFSWHDSQGNFIENIDEKKALQLTNKIDQSIKSYEGVAFCSKKGSSRALTICMLYFIHKYNWTLYKALQFINCKKSDLQVRASFLKLLSSYQVSLRQKSNYNLDDQWIISNKKVSEQQKTINNTYLNSRGSKKQQQSSRSSVQISMMQQPFPQKSIVRVVKNKKKVKVLQKFQIIHQPQMQKPAQVENHAIHLDRVKSKLNEFLQEQSLKSQQNKSINAKGQKKVFVSHRRRFSQKCLTQGILQNNDKNQSKIKKQHLIKRSISPIARSNSHNIQRSSTRSADKRRNQDLLLKFSTPKKDSNKIDNLIKSKSQAHSQNQGVYNLNINVSINSVNFYKERSNKFSNYNRQKLKVYLNHARRKSFLNVTQKDKNEKMSLKSQSLLKNQSLSKQVKQFINQRSKSTKRKKFLSVTQ